MRLKSKHLILLALIGVAGMALPAAAQQGTAPPLPAPASQSRLEVPQTSFDFGYVPQGSSISHVFWLKNVGADTLRITDVRPG